MISLLTSVAPIALGFVGKLFAMKQHAAADQQKLMIQAMQAQNNSINQAREMAAKESPFAAMNNYPGNLGFISCYSVCSSCWIGYSYTHN